MKTCPQCGHVYDEDYIFCLADGNALVDDGPEQETVVNRRFSMPPIDVGPGIAVYCASCGHENKANSKFCKKCGNAVDGEPVSPSPQFGFPGYDINAPAAGQASQFGETVTFRPPTFTPSSPQPSVSSASNRTMLIAVFALGAVLILGLFYLMSNGSSSNTGKNKGSDNANNSNVGSGHAESSLPDSFDRYYDGNVDNGKRSFSLVLHIKRDKSIITGSAQTNSYDELTGSITPDGSFQANGTPPGKPATGIWRGKINSDGTINGSWTDLSGTKEAPYSVTERK
jgi:hypothetical protein